MSATKRVRAARPNPHDAGGELKRFLGICADVRRDYSPENFRANVGKAIAGFVDSLPDESKGLVNDVVGIFGGKAR